MEINDIKNIAIQSIKEQIRMEINDDFEKDDNLIERGLSSIMIMKISNKLRKSGIRISFSKLMEKPTFNEWEMLIKSAKINDKFILKEAEIVKNKEYVGIKFPLTDVQYAYWVGREDDQVLGGVGCHAYLEIDGKDINVKKLNEAWIKLQKDHPMLRAKFNSDGTQEIMEFPYTDEISVYKLENLDNKEIKNSLNEIREKISHRKLKVEEGEVAGLGIALLPEGKTKIFLDIDLLVADVMSLSIMIKELTKNYVGEGEKHSIDYTFKDYIEENKDNQLQLEEDKDFWKTKIENDFPMEAPNLPLKIRPEMVKETKFIRRRKVVDEESWSEIKRLASLHKVTPSMVLLACYGLVIERWTNQEKFLINMPLFNRDTENSNLSNMIADFTNLLLLDYERRLGETLIQTIERVSEVFLENVTHSSYSGVQVQRDMYKEIGNNNNVAPIVFACNIDYPLETEKSREALGGISYMISQTPGVWLDFQTYVTDGKLILCWDAVEELYPEELLNDMFDAFYELLISLTKKENWEKKTDVLSQRQKEIRRQEIEAIIPLKYPDERIYDGFIKNVRLNPSKVAIIDSSTGEEISYRELYDNALKIAFYLQSEGIKKGDYIGITLPRGSRQIFAIFGILFSGAAYVPIGITQPNERRSKIYDQIGINHIISDEETIISCSLNNKEVKIIDLDKGMNSDKGLESPVQVSPYDSAYIIMTSGTTGVPKGVEIMHTSAINTCIDLNKKYNINTNDTVLMVSSIDFDLSVFDIFGLLHAGGTFITTSEDNYRNPDEWLELIDRYNVNIWDSVPILFDMLVTMAEGKKLKLPFRVVMLSGDWIALNLPGRFYNMSNDSVVVAMGGATEASIWSNYLNVPKKIPDNWVSIPYGKPLENQVYKVSDDFGRTCPNYVKGELLIGGVGVAKGYRGDTELTDKKFIVEDDIRWYRTGDNGRIWNDGTIEFLGRKDTQVKVKGHRIELGEIEKALLKNKNITKAVAEVIKVGCTNQIVSFIETNESSGKKESDSFDELKGEIADIYKNVNDYGGYLRKENEKVLDVITKIFTDLGAMDKVYYEYSTLVDEFSILESFELLIKRWIHLLYLNGRVTKDMDKFCFKNLSEFRISYDNTYVELTDKIIEVLKGRLSPMDVFYDINTEITPKKYLKELDNYEENSERIIRVVEKILNKSSGRIKVLEIGGRDSFFTKTLIKEIYNKLEKYVIYDNSLYFKKEIEDILEDNKVKFVKSSHENHVQKDLKYEKFDLVIFNHSLHLYSAKKEILNEIKYVLKSKGIVMGVEISNSLLTPEITAAVIEKGYIKYSDDCDEKYSIIPDNEFMGKIISESGFEKIFISNNKEIEQTGMMVFIAGKTDIELRYTNLVMLLRNELPEYMIPSKIFNVNKLPLNKNNKVDRKALTAILETSEVINHEANLQNEEDIMIKKLVDIFKEALSVDGVFLDSNYFELGGDSLTATRIVTKVKSEFGKDISIADIFNNPKICDLKNFINSIELLETNDKFEIKPDIKNLYEPYNLTDVQFAYWIGRNGNYLLGDVATHCYFELDCFNLDGIRLQMVINEMIKDHYMLRNIILKDGKQKVLEEVPPFVLQINNISDFTENQKSIALKLIRKEMSHQIMKPDEWPLFDFKLTILDEQKTRLHISFDNIILDGWSMFYVLNELNERYEDKDYKYLKPKISFRDYVIAIEEMKVSKRYKVDKQYWINRLDDFLDAPIFDGVYSEKDIKEQEFKRREFYIENETWEQLKYISKQNNITTTSLLITIFSETLKNHTINKEFVLNITQFNREQIHPDINKILGDFTTLTYLEIKTESEKSILSKAKKIQNQLTKDLSHRLYSAIEFGRELRISKNKKNEVLMPIVFTSGLGLTGYENKKWLGELVYNISQTPQVWLDHQVMEEKGRLKIMWDSIDELFPEGLLDRMFNEYIDNIISLSKVNVLENKVKGSNVDIQEVPIDLSYDTIQRNKESDKNYSKDENDILENKNKDGIKEEIIRLWKEKFPNQDICVNSDFFESGGDSLKAVELMNQYRDVFKVDVPLNIIFNLNTVREHYKFIKKLIDSKSDDNVYKL